MDDEQKENIAFGVFNERGFFHFFFFYFFY